MTVRRTVAAACLASFLGLTVATPASAAVLIHGSGTHWSPPSVTIAPGGGVKWTASLGHHTVKAYGGNWTYFKTLASGATTPVKTFGHRGTFRFYCTIHGAVVGGQCTGMCGKVVVR